MKKILLLAVGLIASSIGFTQYTVTKVIGHVTNKASGESLYAGSKLRDDDVLVFSSPNDMLRVIVSGKGIYVISPGPKSEKQQNVIVEMLKSALKVKSKEGYLSGRSEEDELVPAVLQTNAAVNENNLLQAENKYLFNPRNYSLQNGNRFFLQTEVAGTKPVIHALKSAGDTLLIPGSDFSVPGATYKLGYYSKEKNSSQLLTIIKPVIDNNREMETVIKLIIAENSKTGKDALRRACYDEVYQALGKPGAVSFNETFERLMTANEKKAN